MRLIPGYDPIGTAGQCRFDSEAAEMAIGFFHDLVTHVKGSLAGQPFMLEPWQQAIVVLLGLLVVVAAIAAAYAWDIPVLPV